jgi:hypothetical protein
VNHSSQLGAGRIYSIAIMFWGELMGEAIPPTFEARAMPRIRHFPNEEPGGSVRRIGYMKCTCAKKAGWTPKKGSVSQWKTFSL